MDENFYILGMFGYVFRNIKFYCTIIVHIRCFFVVLISTSLPMQLTSAKTLNKTNFEDWKESLNLYLANTDMDSSLREEEPLAHTHKSTTV